jgi:UDPglucose--hexose-1-phosphate uridylyltransferase
MRNPNYRDVFAFQNDYPALLLNRTSFVHFSDANDIIQARTERGVCRVLCYTARHDLTGATMDIPAIARVFDLWREEYQTLCVETEIVHVMIFENKGEMMGTSNPHPDGQIWATAHIPSFSCETSDSSSPHEQSRLYV